MFKAIGNRKNIEGLIQFVAESQNFDKKDDKLTAIVEKCSDYESEELFEADLGLVAAAKKPEIPKYKQLKK